MDASESSDQHIADLTTIRQTVTCLSNQLRKTRLICFALLVVLIGFGGTAVVGFKSQQDDIRELQQELIATQNEL